MIYTQIAFYLLLLLIFEWIWRPSSTTMIHYTVRQTFCNMKNSKLHMKIRIENSLNSAGFHLIGYRFFGSILNFLILLLVQTRIEYSRLNCLESLHCGGGMTIVSITISRSPFQDLRISGIICGIQWKHLLTKAVIRFCRE